MCVRCHPDGYKFKLKPHTHTETHTSRLEQFSNSSSSLTTASLSPFLLLLSSVLFSVSSPTPPLLLPRRLTVMTARLTDVQRQTTPPPSLRVSKGTCRQAHTDMTTHILYASMQVGTKREIKTHTH